MMKKRIAILFHKNEKNPRRKYLITFFADIWQKEGNEVIFLFGIKKFVLADLIIVHVDLSVVPDEYLEFAEQYPIVLNGKVKDIRKSTFSKHLVTKNDPYEGKVIVKSDLNYAGRPERHLQPSRFSRILSKFPFGRFRGKRYFNSSLNYQIFDHSRLVPRAYFKNSHLVVEKFLPEMEKGLYFSRCFYFLGDRMNCFRLASKHPIVKAINCIRIEQIESHPEVLAYRKALKFDYGHFDYTIHQGNVVLHDINKTTGYGTSSYEQETKPFDKYRAGGIYAYFNNSGSY